VSSDQPSEIVLAYLREGSRARKTAIVTMMKGSRMMWVLCAPTAIHRTSRLRLQSSSVIWLIVTGQHEQSLWNRTLLRRVKAAQ